MPPVPRPRDHRVLPLAAGVALGLLGLLEAWADTTFRPHFAELALASAWISASLLAAARWPAAGAVAVAGFYPLSSLLGAPGPGGTGLISVLVAVAYAGYAASARASRLAVAGCVAIFLAGDAAHRGLTWDTVFFPAIFVPAWWVGTLVRREQRRSHEVLALAAELDAQREASAHAAVVEERARIAREVHDSVAHSVSVMTLQIGGLRRQLFEVLADRPPERDVMLGPERLGRQSVEELRATVGILREHPQSGPAAPPPSLSRAEDLVADVRAAGLDVTLEVTGDLGELPRSLDVAAYRVVQEALSNVLRHAPKASAMLRIAHDDKGVHLTVTDDGAGTGTSGVTTRDGDRGPGTGGHGLLGMRERTAMFGGTLDAGPLPGGGFEVQARFPVGREWS